MVQTHNERLLVPAVILACLGCLQAGIDPVFLTLLSSASDVPASAHGWIVSATQTGMAIGSVLTWRWGSTLSRGVFALAAFAATLASLATPQVEHFPTLMVIRGVYGFSMGALYTQGMSHAAVNRPHGAYGAVFLSQLVLSTAVALILPGIEEVAGPRAALTALALAPLGALAIVLASARSTVPSGLPPSFHIETHAEQTGVYAWTAAASSLLFICSTMMVWTFSGGMAAAAGISEEVIGRAVALGSLAGAATAFLVMQERTTVHPAITGVLAGLTLICPIVAIRSGAGADAFVVAIVLLNIGSTAIIVRTSGLASAASRDALFRRFVACVHALGMIIGPLIGSSANALFGQAGLLAAAIFTISTACLLLTVAMAIKGKEGLVSQVRKIA